MYKKIKYGFTNLKIANKILVILLLVSILPLMLVILIAGTIWSNNIISKTNALMESKMNMSQKSLNDYFTTYDNIIMSIYTTEQYASYMEKLNLWDKNSYFSIKHDIEEDIQNKAYLHSGILGMGVYTKKNDLIYFDSITNSSANSYCFPKWDTAWLDVTRKTFDSAQTVYSDAVKRTQEGAKDRYVIYLAHRMADMNNYRKGTIGSIILCLNEEDIRSVYSQKEDLETQLSFLCDREGNIVSCSNEEFIGKTICQDNDKVTQKNIEDLVQAAVLRYGMMESSKYMIYTREVVDSNFIQVSIQDADALLKDLRYIVLIVIMIAIMTILIECIFTIYFADSIEKSMQKILTAMNQVYEGNYNVQIQDDKKDEFGKISSHFNYMVKQIEVSEIQEREALIRVKNAEIKALEAQINPHFLYNTLDAINWIAIENEQFKISKMLKDLAMILRYSIQKSNSVVTMESEMEYLKKYILLQQQRFNFSFKCFFDIEEAMHCNIHKLLFQPLIENAIVHGFPGTRGEDCIWISVLKNDEKGLIISVRDNGRGMEPELVKELNAFDYKNSTVEGSIGIRNVFMRVKYYYGEQGDFHIESNETGTEITLQIQYEGQTGKQEQ